MSVARLLETSRVVVCVGSGGVGKTTVAASLALLGAMRGRRAMVLTIDPARRLAQSLGVATLRIGGERIPAERFAEAGLEPAGELSAGMLDQTSAWDAFITRHSPSVEVRDSILANDFYQHLSRSFAGSTEYMAIEELCRIDESGDFDLIVLDTPPTGHAIDFLEAPRRLEDFFDRGVLSWLVRPTVSAGWSAWKTASRSMRFLFERVEDATGVQALSEIASFFVAVEQLVDGVTARSRDVQALLRSDATSFVLVAGPDEQVLEDAEDLASKMRELGMPLRGVVMNRVHPAGLVLSADGQRAAAEDRVTSALVAAGAAAEAVAWMRSMLDERQVQGASEAVRREAFEAALPASVLRSAVPEQERDVHELRGLATVGRFLEGEGGAPVAASSPARKAP